MLYSLVEIYQVFGMTYCVDVCLEDKRSTILPLRVVVAVVIRTPLSTSKCDTVWVYFLSK
jgi:hypothetical protein